MELKIALIDGYSLLYRAFHALPLMDNGSGEYTNAIYGFMSMLLKVLESEKPQALAVAFDVDKHTFRHEGYSEYKAGRAPTPEEMLSQIDTLKQLLALMNVKMLAVQGYEADDVLGTVSFLCEQQGISALIVTGDRDSYQLAGAHTSILYTKKGITETETVTPAWIREKYGLEPRQLIDVKSLMGDASDNIPGVKGIGEKTAVKLIQTYGSVEKALDAADDQKGALRERLLNGRESALKSRWLAEIVRNVPLDFDFDACRVGDFSAALPLLRRLRLRSIIERMGLKDAELKVETPKALAPQIIKHITAAELETEAAGLIHGSKRVAVSIANELSLANDNGQCLVAPLGGDLLSSGIGPEDVSRALKPLLEQPDSTLIAHGLKELNLPDLSAFEGRSFDTRLACYVINPQRETSSVRDACEALDAPYDSACGAASLLPLHEAAQAALKKDGLEELYYTIELPLCFVLSDMERVGFCADKEYLKELGQTYQSRIAEISRKIYAQAGRELNLNSPKQLKELLFEEMRLPVPGGKKTASSTAADVLEALAGEYPICADILEYRKYQKLYSTYVEGLTAQIGSDGRVHTRFEQAVTGTGRISSREPNLQNIPVRTELGREIRRAFSAAPGRVLVDADYSQIELRVLAAMSGDERMLEAFQNDIDIHRATAAEVFGVPLDEVTPELRSRAKAVNFGVVYGISEYGLAKNTGTGVREAAGFIDSYFERYPGIKRFMDAQVEQGKRQGYVKTLFGRRRYLPELQSQSYQMRSFGERAAMNSPIQGTAADIIKLAMVQTAKKLKQQGLRTRLILQVHDELIMEAPMEEAQQALSLLTGCMEQAVKLSVPLKVETGIGGNWNECKP